ncbi:MAG TPA: EscU/YscU/HrcU family type III secretion system export apparatus switch protein [Candidatus Rubrimentiphilum sp.]|nr:EscU/YscU/HrcU family type III secretion system export apparatus switch protein [Candidatus Rubrimentiphilum sp.]
MADKQFEATQSRLEKARREGDAARSQDLSSLCAFAAGAAAVAAIAFPLGATLHALLAAALRRADWFPLAVRAGALVLVPVCASAAAAIACAVLQAGGMRFAPPAPKLERLSPAENLKRILSRETAIGLLRGLLAFVCAAAAALAAARGVAGASLHGASVDGLADAAWHGSLRAAAAACAAGGIFAVADFATQLRRWRRRLRMSHEELQRDRKEHDGDPLARSRRRSLYRQFARGSLRRVRDAAFVVCNPEHIAVALEYRPPAVPVPRVLVRAADAAAQRVREIAADCGVPLVRNVEVARLLYASAHVDDYIPVESYVAVAEIVADLHKTGGLR